MPWVSIPSFVSGAVASSADMNTYVKNNLAYHQGLLDGTGSDTIVTPGRFPDPTSFLGREFRTGKSVPGGQPATVNDQLSIFNNRSNGDHEVVFVNCHTSPTPGAKEFSFWGYSYSLFQEYLSMTNDGKLTGKGFYSSGERAVAAGITDFVSHGLPARPRFVFGFHAAASTTEGAHTTPMLIGPLTTANTVSIGDVSSTTIQYTNNYGTGTRWCYTYAIL